MPSNIFIYIRKGNRFRGRREQYRVAAVSAVAEDTIFAVLGCRDLRTIGWWLSNGGDVGEVGVTKVS
jgi:hypothetical protein